MMAADLVDTIGLLAGVAWLAGALYWQLISERHCPAKFSFSMLVIGSSLMFLSSALVLQSMPGVALVLAVVGNLLFLLLAVATHVYLSATLDNSE
jgi:hypothetical protein